MSKRLSVAELARILVPLVDLTCLESQATSADIRQLCSTASTKYGCVAAVCVYPRFVALAKACLPDRIKVATVVNFPAANQLVATTCAEITRALASGADEIDCVMPYQHYQQGEGELAVAYMRQVRSCSGGATLKVILETGVLTSQQISEASAAMIKLGADFLKTSTGKVPMGATLSAMESLLLAIAQSSSEVGCKVSGGLRTLADAKPYYELVGSVLGQDALTPERLRFGASALLEDLVNY